MKKQQGFTLIELMIVVAIIGVLSAIAIPTYKNYIVKSDIASGVSTARSLLTNVDLYIQENSAFPETTNMGAIGASADMSSLGTFALVQTSGAEGTITFTFGPKSAVNTTSARFTRNGDGWVCKYDAKSKTIDPEALPKACASGTNG